MIAYVRLIDASNASGVSIFISAAEFLVILASLRNEWVNALHWIRSVLSARHQYRVTDL